MRRTRAFTLVELLVVVGIIGLLAAILVPTLQQAQELTNRTVCMSNLSGINKAAVLYRGDNDNSWPWINNTIKAWDTTEVGTNRQKNPFLKTLSDANTAPRSVTAFMFMLVRGNQSPGMFRCPSDKTSVVAENVKAGDDKDKSTGILEGEYYWDFYKAPNVSYSYQAPRHITTGDTYVNGADSTETELVVYADMTPKYEGDKAWVPRDMSVNTLSQTDIEEQLSYNHKGKQVNILRVASNVAAVKRPDVGDSQDQIYTTYGDDFTQRQKATTVTLTTHTKARDTFLIGPVGRNVASDANSSKSS